MSRVMLKSHIVLCKIAPGKNITKENYMINWKTCAGRCGYNQEIRVREPDKGNGREAEAYRTQRILVFM